MTTPAKAPAKKAQAPARAPRQPVTIEEIGVNDAASGKGQIKMMVLGGPDTGKTRFASAYPRPLYLACEPTVAASIATRKIAYEAGLAAPHVIRIHKSERPSSAMFDALDWLDELPRKTAKGALPKYGTVIFDTIDGYQRLLKDEWTSREGAAMFTGRDAWGFIEGNLNLTLTRMLNLDMNVIVLCHVKANEVEEAVGDSTQKRVVYEPLLQGSIRDSVLNEFDLIGLMEKKLIGDQEHRGISFDPTPTYPFLKDHYALQAPGDKRLGKRFWPVVLEDGTKNLGGSPDEFEWANYGVFMQAMLEGLDDLSEGGVVEELPEAGLPSAEGVMPAGTPGGPVPGATAVPAKAPAKMAAKAVAPAPGGGAAPAPAQPKAEEPAPAPQQAAQPPAEPAPAPEAVDPADAPGDAAAADAAVQAESAVTVESEPAEVTAEAQAEVAVETPATPVAEPEATPEPEAASVEDAATSVPTDAEAVETVQEVLGGEVVAESETSDADGGGCPVCGTDMSKEQPDLVQLSRLKHRTLTLPNGRAFYETGGCCYACYQRLNEEKANGTGLYAKTA